MPSRRAKPAAKKKAAAPAARGRRGKARRSGLIGGIGRLAYWAFVLMIWCGIVGAGVVVYYGARMPAATTWSIPDRAPNIKMVSVDGRLLANRGMTGGEAIGLHEMSPYIPQAVMAIEDRRFYSHFGIDPIGLARAMATNVMHGRFTQGGSTLTQQLAEEPVPETRPDARAQGAGGAAGALAGAEAYQGPDPRNVPQPGLFRLGRLWRGGRVAALFRQERA